MVATVKELSSSKRSAPDAQWLKSFLDTHYQSLIAPRAGTFGVADRLVTQILDTSPSIRDASELFDPRKLVDMIFHNRTKCADQWLQVMKLAEQEHLDLERELLEQSL